MGIDGDPWNALDPWDALSGWSKLVGIMPSIGHDASSEALIVRQNSPGSHTGDLASKLPGHLFQIKSVQQQGLGFDE